MKRHHVSMSIEAALKKPDNFLKVLFGRPGHLLRKELKQRQAAGELLIGSENCEGFDPVTGCPGHEIYVSPKNVMEALRHHLSGGTFSYLSYDHKAAEAEFKTTQEYQSIVDSYTFLNYPLPVKVNKTMIPEDIRCKYPVWRPGKLREAHFGNCGRLWRVKIGHRYSLNFYDADCDKLRLITKK